MRKTFKSFARTLLLSSVLFAGGGRMPLRAEAPQVAKIAVTGVVSDVETDYSDFDLDDDLLQHNINAYLAKRYDSQIIHVEADATSVTIQGNYSGTGKAMLCEIAPWENLTLIKKFQSGEEVTQGSFSIKTDRYVNRDGFIYDRSLSKWALASSFDKEDKIISHARYVDYIQPKQAMAASNPLARKGLAYVSNAQLNAMENYATEFDNLHLSYCSVNFPLTQFICLDPLPNTFPYSYGGRTYYIDKKMIAGFDEVLIAAAKRNMTVGGVIVLPCWGWVDAKSGSLLTDKRYSADAQQAMPDMTSHEAINCYTAAMDFLASRYNRSDNAYGRVHYWIMHNEIDFASTWTNMGTNRLMMVCLDTYYRSMRLCYQIVREYDEHCEVLGSFTHSWSTPEYDYAVLDMIKALQAYAVEGDFRWGIAYHSYPESLHEPKTWNDVNPTFSLNTTRITFKNLEVLDAWIKKPENMYLGTQKRTLWLAENGTNSKTYGEKDIQEQAAGLAYAWKKFKNLDGIDAFLYHGWVDYIGDGDGLRLGLRRFSDDKTNPYGRKPAWYVFEAAGTDHEDAVFEQYKPFIGINDWSEIIKQIN